MEKGFEKAMEVNNEPSLNVDVQQDDNTFKVQGDIDDSKKVQEITAARTPMIINRTVRGTCNQTLALKNWCKKNLSRKSTLSSGEIIATKCSAVIEIEVDNCIYEACQPISSEYT